MIRAFTESIVEEVAVARLRSLGWLVGGSTDIAPGNFGPSARTALPASSRVLRA